MEKDTEYGACQQHGDFFTLRLDTVEMIISLSINHEGSSWRPVAWR